MSAYCQFSIQLFEALLPVCSLGSMYWRQSCGKVVGVGWRGFGWDPWKYIWQELELFSYLPALLSKVTCEGQRISSLQRHHVPTSKLSLSFPLSTKDLWNGSSCHGMDKCHWWSQNPKDQDLWSCLVCLYTGFTALDGFVALWREVSA